MPDGLHAAYAAYGVAFPYSEDPAATAPAEQTPAPVNPDVPARLVVPVREPSVPECLGCGTREGTFYPDPHGHRYPSGRQVLYCGTCVPKASPVQAAAGVITAAMEHGSSTAHELAQAEQDAGLLFDPQRAKDIEDAAREQARTEGSIALDALREQNATLLHFKAELDGIRRLLAGRPGDDLVYVDEVLRAADGTDPRTGAPMTLAWTRIASIPAAGATDQRAIVECTSVHGGRADLVLNGEERQALANLLGLQVRDISQPCATQGCGADHDWDSSNPFLVGWSRLEIAALGDGPRWYCSDMCVFDALARARHELAAEDRAAAVDPHQQAPAAGFVHTPGAETEAVRRSVDRAFPAVAAFLADERAGEAADNPGEQAPEPPYDGRRYFVDDDPPGEDDTEPDFHRIDDDEVHCVRCGCSARRPCPGGCHWVHNAGLVDLCSRCAHPEDILPAPMGGGR